MGSSAVFLGCTRCLRLEHGANRGGVPARSTLTSQYAVVVEQCRDRRQRHPAGPRADDEPDHLRRQRGTATNVLTTSALGDQGCGGPLPDHLALGLRHGGEDVRDHPPGGRARVQPEVERDHLPALVLAAAIRSANPTTDRLILSSRVASKAFASPEASSPRARSNAGRTLPRFALTSSTRTSTISQPRRSTSDRRVASCASRLSPLLACSSEDTRMYRIALAGPVGTRRLRVNDDADTDQRYSNRTLAVNRVLCFTRPWRYCRYRQES